MFNVLLFFTLYIDYVLCYYELSTGGIMFDIEIIKNKGFDVIDSKLLHKELDVASYHKDWIRRRIDGYGFEEGTDFFAKQCSTLSGGSKRKDYLITLDMAKELCMLENNDKGKSTRKYFINAEKSFQKLNTLRLVGIETRKSLTDAIEESGENERMHGRGYSNFTNLVYKVTGLTAKYKQHRSDQKIVDGYKDIKFRDILEPHELKRVELAESLIKPMLKLEKEYGDIKETLEPLFQTKELK